MVSVYRSLFTWTKKMDVSALYHAEESGEKGIPIQDIT
jgi:hypothetical protein